MAFWFRITLWGCMSHGIHYALEVTVTTTSAPYLTEVHVPSSWFNGSQDMASSRRPFRATVLIEPNRLFADLQLAGPGRTQCSRLRWFSMLLQQSPFWRISVLNS